MSLYLVQKSEMEQNNNFDTSEIVENLLGLKPALRANVFPLQAPNELYFPARGLTPCASSNNFGPGLALLLLLLLSMAVVNDIIGRSM